MKISKVVIEDQYPFKHLALDFTYPIGHKKEGQPLDKVCIIGQSGTGKTSILEMVQANLYAFYYAAREPNGRRTCQHLQLESETLKNLKGSISKLSPKDAVERVINFPAETIEASKNIDRSDWKLVISTLIEPASNDQTSAPHPKKPNKDSRWVDFGRDGFPYAWKLLRQQLEKYWSEDISYLARIGRASITKTLKPSSHEKYQEWKQKNPNPSALFAEMLNPILERLNLKIETEIDLDVGLDNHSVIQLKTLNGRETPHQLWSTGTKQLILTMIPLMVLDTEHAVVFMDEPERSLYPDLQRDLVGHYQRVAPTAQFIFATHSPFVASSFEPWEIVELEFNEEGFVEQVPYYDTSKERHVDHFVNDPRYLRWDSISKILFNVQREGNALREDKLQELAALENRIKRERKAGTITEDELMKLRDQYKRIAHLLDWELN